jgi:hypothetical protein
MVRFGRSRTRPTAELAASLGRAKEGCAADSRHDRRGVRGMRVVDHPVWMIPERPGGSNILVARLAGLFLARYWFAARRDQARVHGVALPTERRGKCAAGSHTPAPRS